MPTHHRGRSAVLSVVVAIGGAASLASGPAAAAPPPGATPAPLVGTTSADALPGRYIVALEGAPGTSRASASADALTRAKARGVRPAHTYGHALNGFAATLT